MALSKVLAKEFDWKVDDGTDTDTFVDIGGLNSVSPSPTKNDADTTTYDEDWVTHLVSTRGLEFTLEGVHIEDPDTGDRDSGQERMEEVAELVGSGSVVPFEVTSPGGNTITFSASVNATPFGASTGGGNDDAAGFSYTLTVSGKPEFSASA